MKINPKQISWAKVNERTDGTTIPGEINYTVGVVNADDSVTAMSVLVGELQTDGMYVAQLSEMSFEPGTHTVTMSATEVDTGLTSAWSNRVSFEIVDAKPKAPLAVAVA